MLLFGSLFFLFFFFFCLGEGEGLGMVLLMCQGSCETELFVDVSVCGGEFEELDDEKECSVKCCTCIILDSTNCTI